MSEQLQIETPENISFRYDIAGIGSRFLALLIDSLIQGSLYALLLFSVVVLVSAASRSSPSQDLSNAIAVVILIVIFLIQFGYFILFEIVLNGQTPGKRLIGLRVIKENGYPLSPLDSIIRNIVRVIDFFPFAYGVGVITMFANARAKRLGDLAAGTIVVQVREQVKLSELIKPSPLQSVIAESRPAREMPGLEHLREPDIELIESFFRRRAGLRNAEAIALTIARAIAARMQTPEAQTLTDALSADNFLRDVVAAYRQPKSAQETRALAARNIS